MAAAFTEAGFKAIDVTMSDLLAGETLDQYQALAVCGGFSYGDVLGAGKGWASAILHQARLREVFQQFFERPDTLTLGVCNGCQMLSHLKDLIPGASHWPMFVRNDSKQFEARLSLVEIMPSASILLKGMEGFRLPIVVSHGEGKAEFNATQQPKACVRYINNQGEPTDHYPENPNGSPEGITGLTTEDGRVTIMMPHPERVFKSWQFSWHPKEWGEDSPWMRLFTNAKVHFKN
jgi:phosphoribosylformylglycinamidine synthase